MTPYFAMFLFVVLGSISSALLAFGGSPIVGVSLIACLVGVAALPSHP